jgi:aminopeptidase
VGAASTAKNGAVCIPNIPTEEIFTMPHANQVEGHVSTSKPLSLYGNLIEAVMRAGEWVE